MIKAKLSMVKFKILVLSGKGGVGKSTFTSMLARCFAMKNESENVSDVVSYLFAHSFWEMILETCRIVWLLTLTVLATMEHDFFRQFK